MTSIGVRAIFLTAGAVLAVGAAFGLFASSDEKKTEEVPVDSGQYEDKDRPTSNRSSGRAWSEYEYEDRKTSNRSSSRRAWSDDRDVSQRFGAWEDDHHERPSGRNGWSHHDYGFRRNSTSGRWSNEDEDVAFSNPNNNHDDKKRPHLDKESAMEEMRRMQDRGVPGSDRLNVYFNRETKSWYVGRSKFQQ